MTATVSRADECAVLLIDYVERRGPLDVDQLRVDTIAELGRDPDIEVVFVEPAMLSEDCSIAAAYDRHRTPKRLSITCSASPGRTRFSALHEYAHHLCPYVDEVVEVLWRQPDHGVILEERICDAFAAAVLIPAPIRRAAFDKGVTAAEVIAFIHAQPASRQASAIAAAGRLPAAGYVMLLDRDANAVFTAYHGDMPWVARGTEQSDPLLAAAAQGRRSRGRARIRYASGTESPELLVDAVPMDRGAVVVAVEHSPPWGGFTAGLSNAVVGRDGHCDTCGDFVSYKRPCSECDEPFCPTCGSCECAAPPPPKGARVCKRCNIEKPPTQFRNGSEACNDCL